MTVAKESANGTGRKALAVAGVKKKKKKKKNIAQGISKLETKESTNLRRCSPRIQNIPEEKRPYYGSDSKRKVEVKNEKVSAKKTKVEHHSKQGLPQSRCGVTTSDNGEDKVNGNGNGKAVVTKLTAGSKRTVVAIGDEVDWVNTGTSPVDDKGRSLTARVKEIVRKFNVHYLHFVQEELMRCGTKEKSAHDGNARRSSKRCDLKSVNKDKGAHDADAKRSSMRPDLKALNEMRRKKEILYPEKRFGNLPGVNVGHQFFSRCEMVAIGLHSHWLNGIDYIGKTGKKEYKGYTFPLAVAIVLSGQYEDDVDNSEEIVYTGQGGNDLLGNKRQIEDQKMIRGNLALKNNMEQSIPVRVVRGHKCVTSYSNKLYTYDGLYKVDKYWAAKGAAGYTVYKYRLKRLPGQPVLLTNQVYFSRGQWSKLSSELPGLVCKDICDGQENICIPATNIIDDPPFAPSGFTYTKSITVESGIKIPSSAPGCNCKGKCTNPRTCSCAKLNGSDFPYVSKNGGRLVEAMDVVFECGPNCLCGPECVNRTSQQGLKYKLEVYRTQYKGWAVRSMDYIPSGAPVCEYTGLLRKTKTLDAVSGNDYIFEIDCWQTMNGLGGRERRLRDVSLPSDHADKRDGKISERPDFCIDAGSSGNVARFINHSCEPNLFVQCVLSSHHDVKFARIVLFAADNIPALQELTYDYGYALDSVVGPDGKIKKLACFCGATGCRKRLY
ncbi:histone-lysine N-methyltransferase, H3 lysine-9 specific SUVH4 isoform X1 [Ziziphus jujuba]|uniref:Histone-lysine N-methyltransferase, H3 lysine-9 specific SUVH4 isoform X1 n=3 Tax=Ziziphus jujuba TaxID=326968 RepID=A0ABM3ZX88_ZIZJJ|nr:histone-lysine N-methyltransferase, H3 lysine-9 specific SUVH4 isoform X1 [Ziziphus jujuba]XP_048317985.1 histone-lysine N-methyltransferase, H3 lysine-9 specific SUVH4 isoform X1 [Ziziphus jujuba]XP_048317986.1 histone-lysine N-methyltransferase, H3 lysine-9 specific SUVH4 isoform X1 [Ziziphus jujuba]XP_048317987.1 histone-lysine N-methyltransferase, H3 lysine-9 specific SUVH4 isoform X1 [Ziziphus jujuba]XP_048317988.1 histone-lysine N-methyltransferase, H3 lysine-9 specific SUVH4 isoform X